MSGQRWYTADFDAMAWQGVHVHGLRLVPNDDGTAELVLDAEVLGMINHLVPDVLSADDVADLLQRCAEHISVAEQAIGRQCNVADVGEVLLVDRPGGKIPKEQVL